MRSNSKSHNRRRATKTWLTLLVMVMVLDMLLYNFVYLFPIARAEGEVTEETATEEPAAEASDEPEEAPAEEKATEETSSDEKTEEPTPVNEGDNSSNAENLVENTDPAIATESAENSESGNSEDTWETCSLSSEEENCINNNCGECKEIIGCDGIKRCIDNYVQSLNYAEDSQNSTVAEANTGNNTVSETNTENDQDNNSDSPEQPVDEGMVEVDPTQYGECDPLIEQCVCSAEVAIETGDATAIAEGVNAVNTNIVGDNFFELIIDVADGSSEDVNLVNKFQEILEQNSEGDGSAIVAEINNAADVDNSVIALADTGNNTIETTQAEGDLLIETGDAIAIANAINLVNTNIIGNNWIFFMVNVFGEWLGDLIVPGEGLIRLPAEGSNAILDAGIVNEASVTNDTQTQAGTGTNDINEANIAGDAAVGTGEAQSQSNALNLVNTNIIRNNWFYLLINNMGVWTGRIINWNKDKPGDGAYAYDFDVNEGDPGIADLIYFRSHNSANVKNTVVADANTGGNSINSTSGGNASIFTGAAKAVANAMNLVNTNIIGNNWMFGVVNIFGQWKGDANFAYPNLSVSLDSNKSAVGPGDNLEYKITCKNNGKAKAENVVLKLALSRLLNYIGDEQINFPVLDPGEEKSFTIKAQLNSQIPEGVSSFESEVEISTSTKEVETSDNSSESSVDILYPQIEIVDELDSTIESGLTIKRSVNPAGPFRIGDIITHLITVKNQTKETVYYLTVTEKIKGPSGNTIAEYQWSLEKLKRGQKAYIQYQIVFDGTAELGTYKATAKAESYNEYNQIVKGKKAALTFQVEAGGYMGNSQENNGEIVPAAATTQETPGDILGAGTGQPFQFPLWAWILSLFGLMVAASWKRLAALKWQKAWAWAQAVKNAIFSFFF
jgi:uncharacterized repeat protein (TIGR01451 family)